MRLLIGWATVVGSIGIMAWEAVQALRRAPASLASAISVRTCSDCGATLEPGAPYGLCDDCYDEMGVGA